MTLQKVTKKVTMEVKRIVNVDRDLVYIVHYVKVCGERQRHNISCICLSGLFNSDILKDVIRKIMSIVKAVPVYGWHMQTVRGAVSITR